MKDPNIIKMSPNWVNSLEEWQSSNDGENWVPSRAVGFASPWYRIKAAWLVFTGKADALVWPQGQ